MREHITDGNPCWCAPKMLRQEDGSMVVVHNRLPKCPECSELKNALEEAMGMAARLRDALVEVKSQMDSDYDGSYGGSCSYFCVDEALSSTTPVSAWLAARDAEIFEKGWIDGFVEVSEGEGYGREQSVDAAKTWLERKAKEAGK